MEHLQLDIELLHMFSECNCTLAGATSHDCSQDSGDCSCKANVIGTKCDRCATGSFNLDAANPDGCQPCFCHGHATECHSAEGYEHVLLIAGTAE